MNVERYVRDQPGGTCVLNAHPLAAAARSIIMTRDDLSDYVADFIPILIIIISSNVLSVSVSVLRQRGEENRWNMNFVCRVRSP